MSYSRVVGMVSILVGLAVGGPASAVVDGTNAPNADRRFDAVGLFIATAPGGGCGGWISGTCTLISPTTVLIARHSLDVSPTQAIPTVAVHPCRVRFRRTTDGVSENNLLVNGTICHGVYQEIDIVQLTDASNPNSDQVIATLDHAPVGIRPIGTELSAPPTAPTNVILAGWGYAGQCFGTGPSWALRIARGTTPSNVPLSNFLTFSNCSEGSTMPCLVCPAGPARVNANLHDSGAPILIEVPSTDPFDTTPELRLVGTVTTTNYARRPSSWNHSGGVPQLAQAAASSHLKKSDFDGNGEVTTTDMFTFFNAFFAGRLDADASGNGVLDVQDVFSYLDAWFNVR